MPANVLILGGTGILSSGITQACQESGFQVYHLNRGSRRPAAGVETIVGDRYNPHDLERASRIAPDVVIDMLGFTPQQADLVVAAFGGKIGQLIFCSTCCVYDLIGMPGPLREDAPVGSHWHYGISKQQCEAVYLRAHENGLFNCTIFRPSHVYSDTFFVHQFGFDGALLIRRLLHGLPLLLFDEGKQLWQACHHQDVGIAFAHACLREKCYGQIYNLSYKETFSWKECYLRIADAFERPATLLSVGPDILPMLNSQDYEFLLNVTRFDFAADPSRLYRDIPEFEQRHLLEKGVRSFWRHQKEQGTELHYDPLLTEIIATKALPC